MFDRCRAWRSLLSRRAEGLLSPSERALLNEHLSKCAACLQARDADEALETACVAHDVRMSPNGAHAVDDTVIATLRAQPSTEGSRAGWRDRVREVAASLSYEYCLQLAGGALAAASVTAFALVSALNPAPTSSRTLSSYELRSMSAEERNDPPVPLESLFQSPSPRAAMLWGSPGPPLRRIPAVRSEAAPAKLAPAPGHSTAAPRRHGRTGNSLTMG
jgi:hypothetical protein